MATTLVLLGFLTFAPWLVPRAKGSGAVHTEDGSLNASALWDYIHDYEARDDVPERPPLVHDVAWLTLNVTTTFPIQCPLVFETEVTPRNTTTIVVNTTSTTDIKFTRHRPGGFDEDICRLTVAFREHGDYWLFMDYATAQQHSPCLLLLVNDPPQAEMPILFVGLGLLGLAAFVTVALKLYSCARRSVKAGKRGDISEPAPSPDSNTIDLDKDSRTADEETAGQGTQQEDSTVDKKKKPRLRSLDTFRGLNIVVMIFVNYGGGGYWIFEHPPWNGLTVADLVFPWFIFIMGTSMTFSFKSMFRRHGTSPRIVLKVLTRVLKLFALGIVLNSSWDPVDLAELRILGVLQRIALTYLVTALLKLLFYSHTKPQDYKDRRWAAVRDVVVSLPEWLCHLALLALYLGLTYGLPVPDCPTGYTGPGGLSEGGAHRNCTGGAARYIDVTVLGESHLFQFPTPKELYKTTVAYDPEGILGTLTSVFLCFLGVQSGNVLSVYQEHRSRVVRWLIWAVITGVPAAILSKCSQNDGWIPVNKNIWSLSFVLTTASFAFLVLTAFYLLIDVWGLWTGQPFTYPGMNSIVIFFCHEIFWRVLPINWVVEEVHWKLLLKTVWGTAFWVIVAYILFRKKIFVAL
ncbi:heparan-alpha-glucosaminide N-acetyltransferase-like isoform X2 [Babylonia areolata]|uniref:heparan-alpha-glucosaminide N-acetyltransferase-like isoform X2 n=1 Tax=Babylonia areolata TaxID=304850 RepID=UPI003FD5B729